MNYFNPNFYQNYPYAGNSQYSQNYPLPLNQQQSVSMQNQFNPQQNVNTGLNGKMVDTIDMVKVTEVPIGGYGIFPKADLNEIYVKTWNPNGTTSITTFTPFISPESESKQEAGNEMTTVLERIEKLEEKIDAAIGCMTQPVQTQEPKPTPAARKEF